MTELHSADRAGVFRAESNSFRLRERGLIEDVDWYVLAECACQWSEAVGKGWEAEAASGADARRMKKVTGTILHWA